MMLWDIMYRLLALALVTAVAIIVYKIYEYTDKSHAAIARTA